MVDSKDVVFIHATHEWELCNSPPLSIGYLQTVLERNNIQTHLYDTGRLRLGKKDSEAVARKVCRLNPKIVGISTIDTEGEIAKEFARKIRERDKDIIICMGGHSPTTQPERYLDVCDFVVRGEAEKTVDKLFPKIVAGKYNSGNLKDNLRKVKGLGFIDENGKYFSTENPEIYHNLDDLPFPLRRDIPPECYPVSGELIKWDTPYYPVNSGVYNTPVATTRGCTWHSCTFCGAPNFPGAELYRVRSNESLMSELREVNECGLGVVADQSACSLGGRPKQMGKFLDLFGEEFEGAYLDLMIRPDALLRSREAFDRNIKNIYRLCVGVENFSDSILKRYNKGITSETNIEAVKFLEHLRKKRGTSGVSYPTTYIPLTIDFDPSTTQGEFRDHYGQLEKLGILGIWDPNYMQKIPFTSKEQQEEFWETTANPYALSLKRTTDDFHKAGVSSAVSAHSGNDLMRLKAEEVRRVFGPLAGY